MLAEQSCHDLKKNADGTYFRFCLGRRSNSSYPLDRFGCSYRVPKYSVYKFIVLELLCHGSELGSSGLCVALLCKGIHESFLIAQLNLMGFFSV